MPTVSAMMAKENDDEAAYTITTSSASATLGNAVSRFVVALHLLTVLVMSRLLKGVEVFTSEYLAASVNTNPVVVRRILGRLREAGLVISVPGPTGGSRLARDPEQVTLEQVYEAVEEGELFHMHYNEPNPQCPVGCNIQQVLQAPLEHAAQAMKESLATRTLADIAAQMKEPTSQRVKGRKEAELIFKNASKACSAVWWKDPPLLRSLEI